MMSCLEVVDTGGRLISHFNVNGIVTARNSLISSCRVANVPGENIVGHIPKHGLASSSIDVFLNGSCSKTIGSTKNSRCGDVLDILKIKGCPRTRDTSRIRHEREVAIIPWACTCGIFSCIDVQVELFWARRRRTYWATFDPREV